MSSASTTLTTTTPSSLSTSKKWKHAATGFTVATLVLYLAFASQQQRQQQRHQSNSNEEETIDHDGLQVVEGDQFKRTTVALATIFKLGRIARYPFEKLSKLMKEAVQYWDTKSSAGQPLQPLADIFSPARMESALMAYLPNSQFASRFLTGVYAVDMAVFSILATSISSSGIIFYDGLKRILQDDGTGVDDESSVRIRVDFLRRGAWCCSVNQHHQALQWLISRESKSHKFGFFRMVPFESEYGNDRNTDDDDEAKLLDFNILPGNGDSFLDIKSEGHTFRVHFDYSQVGNDETKNDNYTNPTEPPILIQRINSGPTSIQWMKDWLNRVTLAFIKYQHQNQKRSRYEYDLEAGDWRYVHSLHSSRGLASVALDIKDEDSLKTDLQTFLADHEFYKRMGMPYKRGYMFTGRPGTGKTSLINAISAEYDRDIYFMNLKEFQSDKQLQNAFSRVPKNCIVVFEDVDAQSRCVWNRQLRRKLEKTEKLIGPTLPGASDEVIVDDEDAGGDEGGEKKEGDVESASEKKVVKAKSGKDKKKTRSRSRSSSADSGIGTGSAGDATPVSSESGESEDGGSKGEEKVGDDDDEKNDDKEDEDKDDDEEEDKRKAALMSAVSKFLGSSNVPVPPPPPPVDSGPTLATLLNCLDGHSTNEGIIVVMTTNHPEVLDPAVTRPGRIDLHLSLGNCTHYQLNRMYKMVLEDENAILEGVETIPEGVLAPCEAMRIMVLHRKRPNLILETLMQKCADTANFDLKQDV
ncbi:hypothetical protein HDU76_001313 [Blyttiomyces sp. JEL0837]|nr:hypothetical protein HDU76_001313 [Blyttiomyces sp. JEL0837]